MNKVAINLINIRDFATDKHAMTDDRPFGGGEGMVMKPEPLAAAVQAIRKQDQAISRVVMMSPQGKRFDQSMAQQFANDSRIVLVCGRYEGIDERFRMKYVNDEVSVGDFVLSGGELAAMIIVDSVVRLLPGVLGCSDSYEKDTFSRNLLKHPQYTRPPVFEDLEVPEILLSGDHRRIEEYRFLISVERTLSRRPELLALETFTKTEIKLLKKHGLYQQIEKLYRTDE